MKSMMIVHTVLVTWVSARDPAPIPGWIARGATRAMKAFVDCTLWATPAKSRRIVSADCAGKKAIALGLVAKKHRVLIPITAVRRPVSAR